MCFAKLADQSIVWNFSQRGAALIAIEHVLGDLRKLVRVELPQGKGRQSIPIWMRGGRVHEAAILLLPAGYEVFIIFRPSEFRRQGMMGRKLDGSPAADLSGRKKIIR